MKNEIKQGLDALITESEDLLQELAEVEEIFSLPEQLQSRAISDTFIKDGFNSLEKAIGLNINATIELHVDADSMSLWADFLPSSQNGSNLVLDQVEKKLSQMNIYSGIKWEVIKDCIEKCNIEKKASNSILIASGLPPEDYIPPHIKINPELKTANIEGDSSIDYKEISPFIMVKRFDVIAISVSEKLGKSGYNVYGDELPAGIKKQKKITPGKNIVDLKGKYIAALDGKFEQNGLAFQVNNVLEVKSDVDYRTGNIRFDGDVIVNGSILNGFIVEAGGSLFCRKTLDASSIIVQSDLIVGFGIIGRNKGKVISKGGVKSKFVESCYIEAEKSIVVKTAVMNSIINTRESLILGKRGVVVGGKMTAQNGLDVYQLGSERGPKTEIVCGIDFTIRNRIEWIKNKSVELTFQLQAVEKALKVNLNKRSQLENIKNSLKVSLLKLSEAAMSCISQLDKNEDAKVIVHGSVFPDTYIEINHVSFLVTCELSAVEFSLDKHKGKIVLKRLS